MFKPGEHVLLKLAGKFKIVKIKVNAPFADIEWLAILVNFANSEYFLLDPAIRHTQADLSDLHKELLSKVLHRFVIFDFGVKEVTVHLQELNPELFK